MQVRRIVANLETPSPAAASAFYRDILGLDLLMDHGWIATYGSSQQMSVQVSFASEGGAGTPIPGLSIEVDDVDEAYAAMRTAGFEICYGPADEPWGIRRFYVRDPFGTLVNILSHKA
ncbi:VOC family protein [Rhizobium sp. BK068]|uniref:VOC family protein n=1 Tax=Rhizobium sp. BK068 TaxID=2512130 RepID=UPI0010521CCE|nr:VOC family protein [Rhizobium sp. BK068]TCM79908.1 putative glyoxalase superfamily protein PhnB [Rhizobium sp. BK068]